MTVSNFVDMMTSFWNNLLPGNAQSQKMGKPNNFKVFQNNKAKGSRQEDKTSVYIKQFI